MLTLAVTQHLGLTLNLDLTLDVSLPPTFVCSLFVNRGGYRLPTAASIHVPALHAKADPGAKHYAECSLLALLLFLRLDLNLNRMIF